MKINSGKRSSECIESLNDCHPEEGDSPPRDREKLVKRHCSSPDADVLPPTVALEFLRREELLTVHETVRQAN